MSTPSAAWTARSERVGGAVAHTLFVLAVTHPTPATWLLAPIDLAPPSTGWTFDPETFDPGVFAVGWAAEPFRGLVREHSGVPASAALAGLGAETTVTLTLINALGTGAGPGRRFMDVFATNVPGYAEPYDLLTATLNVYLIWADRPDDPFRIGAQLHLQPGGVEWRKDDGEPETVTLTFGPDQRRYRTLPRVTVSTRRYPHAPDSSIGQPVIPWFGEGLRVPCLPLDADGGRYLIGASPASTPLSGVTRLWTIRPDPGASESTPIALPVRLTTAAEAVLALTVGGTDLTLTQVAQRVELEGDGAFLYAVQLRMKRASGGTPGAGSITVALRLDADGLPGEALIDALATAEVNATLVSSGSYADYVIPFQANVQGRAAFVPGGRGFWIEVKYAKASGGGDLHVEVDNAGTTFLKGFLATKATATDQAWLPTGRQTRRGVVRQDFTGIGYLLQRDDTGDITTRPSVTVPGA